MDTLHAHIEALIFISPDTISLKDIKACLEESMETEFKQEELEDHIASIRDKYADVSYGIELINVAGGYRFMTKGVYYDTIATYLRQNTKKQLSRPALETLSIIAYKQPVTKSELEKIRGVSCDYSIQKLLEKELVEIQGRSDGPGRPLLYGTGEKFMKYYGISDLNELPKTKDFQTPENEVGEPAPIEEEIISESRQEEE